MKYLFMLGLAVCFICMYASGNKIEVSGQAALEQASKPIVKLEELVKDSIPVSVPNPVENIVVPKVVITSTAIIKKQAKEIAKDVSECNFDWKDIGNRSVRGFCDN